MKPSTATSKAQGSSATSSAASLIGMEYRRIQHLRLLVREYVAHYHRERNHQGLDNQVLQRASPPASRDADVQRRQRIGGLLSYYHREAA